MLQIRQAIENAVSRQLEPRPRQMLVRPSHANTDSVEALVGGVDSDLRAVDGDLRSIDGRRMMAHPPANSVEDVADLQASFALVMVHLSRRKLL